MNQRSYTNKSNFPTVYNFFFLNWQSCTQQSYATKNIWCKLGILPVFDNITVQELIYELRWRGWLRSERPSKKHIDRDCKYHSRITMPKFGKSRRNWASGVNGKGIHAFWYLYSVLCFLYNDICIITMVSVLWYMYYDICNIDICSMISLYYTTFFVLWYLCFVLCFLSCNIYTMISVFSNLYSVLCINYTLLQHNSPGV